MKMPEPSKRPPYRFKNGLTTKQQIVSSCAGAVITSIFMTPFDVVKVRLQAQQRESLNRRCFVYCNGLMDHICNCATATTSEKRWYSTPMPIHLNGTVDAFVKITRSEGLQTLWSGLPPTLVVAVPNTIIYLTTYEQILKATQTFGDGRVPPAYAGGIAGALARGWSVTVVSPFELLRTKIQAKNSSYREVLKILRKDFISQGPSSLWKGWGATLCRDMPFSAFYWGTYENLKHIFHQTNPTVGFTLVAGSVAGGLAGVATLPLDVVKTHQQIEIEKKNRNAHSTLDILSNIYRKQGYKGLFTGLVPRLAKVMPACAIMISSYEYAKAYFRQKNRL